MLVIEDCQLVPRLQTINACSEAGQQIHLLGENGAGKSTLLHILSGLLSPEKGKVEFRGQDVHQMPLNQLAHFRAYQEQQQQTHFSLKVEESLQFFSRTQGLPSELEQALEIVDFLSRPLQTLSGGELRRVHLARVMLQIWPALSSGHGFLLLDEPTQGLDFRHQHQLFMLLSILCERGNTVVVSHHDLNLCYRYAQQIWLLKGGALLAQGAPQQVMNCNILETAFTCKIEQVDGPKGRLFRTYMDPE